MGYAPLDIYPGLRPFLAKGQLLAQVLQDQMIKKTEHLEDKFHVDLASGTITLTGKHETLQMPCHFVASIAPGPRSILWGFAHPRGDNVAATLEEWGQNGVAELAEPELPFPDAFPETPEAITGLAHEIGVAVCGMLTSGPYYTFLAGESRQVLLLDPPFERPSIRDVGAMWTRLLSEGLLDSRQAVRGLAEGLGWKCDERPDGMSLSDSQGSIEIELDDHGRISKLYETL